MKKQRMILYNTNIKNKYRTLIRTKHGRIIYLGLEIQKGECHILECYYTDRIKNCSYYATPKKLTTKKCDITSLLDIVAQELDRVYFGVEHSDSFSQMGTEGFIRCALEQMKRGYKFLILVSEGNQTNSQQVTLKTRLKNRIHRSIYLEITHSGGKGTITSCHYYDREYKRNNAYITPSGLTSISFDFSIENIISIVNNELNCDFTDVIITPDSFAFDNNNLPLCGSI